MSCVLISSGKRLVDGYIQHMGMGIVSVHYKVGIHTTGIQMTEKGYRGY